MHYVGPACVVQGRLVGLAIFCRRARARTYYFIFLSGLARKSVPPPRAYFFLGSMPLPCRFVCAQKGPLDLGIMHVVRTDQKHLLAWSVKIKRRKPELTRLPILWHASATQQQRGGIKSGWARGLHSQLSIRPSVRACVRPCGRILS